MGKSTISMAIEGKYYWKSIFGMVKPWFGSLGVTPTCLGTWAHTPVLRPILSRIAIWIWVKIKIDDLPGRRGKKTWNISKSQVRILSPNHLYNFDPTACTKCTKKPAPIWGQLQHWTRANPRPKSGGSTKGARSSQSRAYRFSMAIWHGFESQKRNPKHFQGAQMMINSM